MILKIIEFILKLFKPKNDYKKEFKPKGDKKMAEIKRIIVHCSASNWGDAEVIKDWHVNNNGWRDVGYHYIILNGNSKSSNSYEEEKDGMIEGGRELSNDTFLDNDEKGAHAAGLNSDSIGVCLIGNEKFTRYQIKSLVLLCSFWKKLIPDIEINGHYQFNNHKTCPNFLIDELKQLIDEEDIDSYGLNYIIKDLEENINIV